MDHCTKRASLHILAYTSHLATLVAMAKFPLWRNQPSPGVSASPASLAYSGVPNALVDNYKYSMRSEVRAGPRQNAPPPPDRAGFRTHTQR